MAEPVHRLWYSENMVALQTTPPPRRPHVWEAPENARDRIFRLAITHDTDDPDTLAAYLIDELDVTGEAAAVLWNWVRNGVRSVIATDYHRQAQARAEYAGPVTRHKAGTTDGSTEFRSGPMAFLDAKVLIRGGFKKWRDLTQADHEERIAIHGRNATAALASKQSHEWAIERMAAHHATTLGDISEEVLAGELPEFKIRT